VKEKEIAWDKTRMDLRKTALAYALLIVLICYTIMLGVPSRNREKSSVQMETFKVHMRVLVNDVREYRFSSSQSESRLDQLKALTLMSSESEEGKRFRETLSSVFFEQPLKSYFWECSPTIEKSAAVKPFEFVIAPAPSLEKVESEPEMFESSFKRDSAFSTFTNLGGDAILVSPRPFKTLDYGHLARFMRNAPGKHIQELFMHVGQAALERLSTKKPLWISTSGLGVFWLHVRIDDAPKYYSFSPYRVIREDHEDW